MKQTITTLLIAFLLGSSLNAQFTLTGKYETNIAPDWDELVSNSNLDSETFLNNSISFNVGYWLKPIKEYRYNLIPEIGYSKSTKTLTSGSEINTYDWNRIELTLNNHIYFMDMESDCNCPTFSKQGNFLSKGLYLNIAPGVSYNNFDYTFESDLEEPQASSSDSKITPKLSIGAGFDIGLHDLITITPFFNFTKRFSNGYEPMMFRGVNNAVTSSTVNQKELGIRLTMRFDYVRQNGGFRR